jgi:precorrin-6B methylase 2
LPFQGQNTIDFDSIQRRDNMDSKDKSRIGLDMRSKAENIDRIRVESDEEIRLDSKLEHTGGRAAYLMQKPEIDSDRLFKLLDSSFKGLKECRLIATAFELEVFEALKVPLSADVLAEKLGCDPGLMPHFCEALLNLGLLDRFGEEGHKEEKNKQITEKRESVENAYEAKILNNKEINGSAVYLVSELSATYLLESSPFSQQHYLAERLRNIELWARLPQILRKGPEIFEKGPFFGEIVQCMAENARCGMLQETVRVVMENVDFGNVKKMLDLGGGHGLYTIAFAKLNENMQAFVFDLPLVTEKTKYFIEKYGASNVAVIPGDFFKDEIGSEYDMIFSSFNPGGKVPILIPKIAEALNPGGIFVTRQVPDEKMKYSPLLSLDWNLWTFEDVKKGGSSYSFENSIPFSEYIEMLENYGLEVFRTLDMMEASKIVFARKIA